MLREDQDFCVGVLKSGGTQVHTFYSGHDNAGDRPEVKADVSRNEAAELTTYDVAIPWSEFGLSAGLSPIMKVSFQINNTNGKLGDQTRLYWGGGVGGRFATWKFKTVAIGQPPAGTRLASLSVVKSYVESADDYVEARAATTHAAASGPLSIRRHAWPARAPPGRSRASRRLARWVIRAYPGAFHGSVPLRRSR